MSFRPAPEEADRAGIYRLLIVVSSGANTIRLMRATTDRALSPGVIVAALEDAMTQAEGDLVPARPPAILVDDPALLDAIELPMRSCGVEVRLERSLPAIDPVLEALGQRRGLFSDRTLIGAGCYEAELADAAARIATTEPWRYFIEELPLAVSFGNEDPCIVVVLGTMGQCHGIACYQDEATFHQALAEAPGRAPGDPIPFDGWSLLFDPACAVPAAHRAALARRDLPICHALYPRFQRFVTGAPPLELTDRNHARRVEHTLHALVALVEEHGDELIDSTYVASKHQLPGGSVSISARRDLAAPAEAELEEDELSPFIEEEIGGWMPPDPMFERLIPADHMMLVTEVPAEHIASAAPELAVSLQEPEISCLVIRSTKKNARLAAKALRDVDGLGFARGEEQGREIEIIYGARGAERAGVLSVFGATHDQPSLEEELEDAIGSEPYVFVVLVGGGTRRPPTQLAKGDVVAVVRLRRIDVR